MPSSTRIRSVLITAVIVVAGVLCGLGITWWMVADGSDDRSVAAGAWRTNLLTGSATADLYTRAKIARAALLALSREETMYYIAIADDHGDTLRTECSYRISGKPPAARWWSITAYGQDFFLMDVADGRYSLSGDAVTLDALGNFQLTVGPGKPADGSPWISTRERQRLVLTLRLYNPEKQIAENPASLAAPTISKGECQ